MKRIITTPGPDTTALVKEAWQDVGASFERFCLTAGIATLSRMMTEDAERLCGPRHGRSGTRTGHRWGRTKGKIGFHGGTVPVERPRVRSRDGAELPLPSWEAAQAEDWLGQWAMNLMLINVSTRKFGRAVRLPGGDVPAPPGDGRSKSAVSRRFVELSATRMAEWMASDLSKLDLVAIQIDGLHIQEELILVGAVGIDAAGDKPRWPSSKAPPRTPPRFRRYSIT
jgi:putative transposase